MVERSDRINYVMVVVENASIWWHDHGRKRKDFYRLMERSEKINFFAWCFFTAGSRELKILIFVRGGGGVENIDCDGGMTRSESIDCDGVMDGEEVSIVTVG